MRKIIILLCLLIASNSFAEVLKFRPALGVFDSGVISIQLDYATINDKKWDATELFYQDLQIFYTTKCVEVEYTDNTYFYYINIIVETVIEDGNVITGPFTASVVAKNNGTLSSWTGFDNNAPFSLQLFAKFWQPLAMSYCYPVLEVKEIFMWQKKYNWPRKKDYDITFNGDFYIKDFNKEYFLIRNDVFFCLPDSRGFSELNMSNVNGHITSDYEINRLFTTIDNLDGRFVLRFDIEDDRAIVFFDIKKGE